MSDTLRPIESRKDITSAYPWQGSSPREWNNWKWQYRNRIRTVSQLTAIVKLSPDALKQYSAVTTIYPFAFTPYYFSLIDAANDDDPLRRQCFPDRREIDFSTGSVSDPLHEEGDMPVPGLIHRYRDRCVALVTNTCATYCRHCNRKRLWGKGELGDAAGYLERMVDYVRRTGSIREVIISGGDPLTMKETVLDWFLESLRSIRHVEVLRVGSRVPVVMPMRITRKLCSMLSKHRPLWFNTHFNHPNEITPESAQACEMLLQAGIPVSSQSVLLQGVNDNYETLKSLFRGLQRISVRPYYLFHCDPVKGTDHFRNDVQAGIAMMEKLWRTISGLCMPQYVLDLPGGKGKVPLYPGHPFRTVVPETGELSLTEKGK